MKILACGLLVALLDFMASAACAGVVHGTLHVPAVAPSAGHTMNPYPGRAGSMAGMHAAPRGLASDAVIYVDHVPAGTEAALAADATVAPKLAQKDQSFVPRVVAVAAGSRVDFPNLDPIYHNVFSLSPIRRFDLGKYPRGSSRQVTFPTPGLVNVYCDIHSDMEGFILVLPHHGFARPSASGEFTLPKLPAGHYVLHAWHPDLGEQSMPIEVTADGPASVDMRY
jgi:plastocyanin